MSTSVHTLDTEAFARDGYVRVPDFLAPAEVLQVRMWVAEIEAWPAGTGGWFQHDEQGGSGVFRARTENFSPDHDGLRPADQRRAARDGRCTARRAGRPL